MKKVLVALLVLALMVGGIFLAWKILVDEPPEDSLLRAAAAAMIGDEQGFLDGFTDDSRPMVAAILAMARGEDMSRSKRHPYYYMATENIVAVERDTQEFARIHVRRPGDDKGRGYHIPMVRGCDPKYLMMNTVCLVPRWQIDAKRFTGGVLSNADDDKRTP